MTADRSGRGRIAFIGAGHVGATAAYAMMLRALFRDIVLIDRDDDLARAEAADLADANALARPAQIRAGTWADAAGAEIAVLTAGAASKGDENRLALASRSAVIVTDCVTRLVDAGFTGVLVVASNPVDLMTTVAIRHAGLAEGRVIGTGTLLDSARLRQVLADRLDVASGAIDAMVLGEHGDSEVAAFSTARIGGMPIAGFAGEGVDLAAIAARVRDSGYRIVEGKGYTSYGIATAIVRICEAIRRDECAVLPVSVRLTGQYGIDDVCMSLPCVIGATGIVRVLTPTLSSEEAEGMRRSAQTLRTALAGMDAEE